MKILAELRENYGIATLLESDVHPDPFVQFQKWMDQAMKDNIPEPNAMTLATVDKIGKPSARIVLLKGFSEEGFKFFTHYTSKKGKQIEDNENVALLFWWQPLERQIRIEGKATRLSRAESEIYFHSRPKDSQVGAETSSQSKVLENREVLEKKFLTLSEKYADVEKLQLPQNWGGYCVVPHLFEFWQGRPNRLHDRLQYRLEKNAWIIERLGP